MSSLKVLELFGGIGACSKALERLGIDYEIADYVEIDKYAVRSFNAMHNTNFKPQDICTWNKDLEVDLIMHGSPCQDFSLAGKQAGGDEGSGTRSSLMYETIRIVEKLKPKYVIWENVKNLLGKKHRHNFDKYLETIESLGYKNYYQVLNEKDYGIPQNRERVFTVSIRADVDTGYIFPSSVPLTTKLEDMLEDTIDEKYYLSDNSLILKSKCIRLKKLVDKTNFVKKQVLNMDLYNQKVNTDIAQTLTDPKHNTQRVFDGYRIRKYSPKELWRLMGFDDNNFNKAKSTGNSDTQLGKQAGNSIVVNVLEAILRELFKAPLI